MMSAQLTKAMPEPNSIKVLSPSSFTTWNKYRPAEELCTQVANETLIFLVGTQHLDSDKIEKYISNKHDLSVASP